MKITKEWMNKHWMAIFAIVFVALIVVGIVGFATLEPTVDTRPRSATRSHAPTRPTPTPLPGQERLPPGVSHAEMVAIKAVQQYAADGTNTVLIWVSVVMAAKKAMGDNIDMTDAYWSARKNGQRFQVRFSYKEDGRWQYAEWRYVPSTGLVFGENQLGQMTVR